MRIFVFVFVFNFVFGSNPDFLDTIHLWGNPVYIRIIKNENILEVFMKDNNNSGIFQLLKTYSICSYSGGLGPKKRQGDKKSPEGFYYVKKNHLNPNSNYYLSFNIGYPNDYDRYYGYTGNYIMIHGGCESIGCYSITDYNIVEVYQFVRSALDKNESKVNVDIYPFRMTNNNMEIYQKHPDFEFWKQLKVGYDYFELYKKPPNMQVYFGKYTLQAE